MARKKKNSKQNKFVEAFKKGNPSGKAPSKVRSYGDPSVEGINATDNIEYVSKRYYSENEGTELEKFKERKEGIPGGKSLTSNREGKNGNL